MTPDNGAFAVAAYTCAAIIYSAYALSVVVRERRLREKLESLEDARR